MFSFITQNIIRYLLFILFPFLIYNTLVSRLRKRTKTKYPPGPSADPLIGHARFIPLDYAWKTFTEWGKKFGEIVYVHVLGRPMIILNSFDVAKELLEKRGVNYSDRPLGLHPRNVRIHLILLFISRIVSRMHLDCLLAFQRYGDRFRRHRKLLQQHWNAQSALSYRPAQRMETHVMLQNLLKSPERYQKHIERAVTAGILFTTYGHHVTSDDDIYVHLAEQTTKLVTEPGTPGGTIVDFFPIRKYMPAWFPGAHLQRHAIKTRSAIKDMLERPYNMVREQRAQGTARHSFMNMLLEEYEKKQTIDLRHEDDMMGVGAVLFGGAVETTIGSLLTFVMGMVICPEAAKKAQRELDEFVGRSRLPEFEDRENLPYIDCILKETLRFNPPLPLGVPHASIESDDYKGQKIPEKAMVIPNLWAMMRDEDVYPNPDVFNPDRFLNKEPVQTSEGGFKILGDFDPASAVFGFGRRLCPGRFYADAGMWLSIACMLACFDILPALDAKGGEIIPKVEFTSGTTSQPQPFKCRFVLRDPAYAKLIEQAVEASTV